MSVSLLGLPGLRGGQGFAVRVDEPGCVAKSFPRFWELWEKVRA
jgi:3-phosphoshikimate 1-carboxyvinyltransferase